MSWIRALGITIATAARLASSLKEFEVFLLRWRMNDMAAELAAARAHAAKLERLAAVVPSCAVGLQAIACGTVDPQEDAVKLLAVIAEAQGTWRGDVN